MFKEILLEFISLIIGLGIINIILYCLFSFIWWEWLDPFDIISRTIYVLEFVLIIFYFLEEYT